MPRKHIPFPIVPKAAEGVTYTGTTNFRAMNSRILKRLNGPMVVNDPRSNPIAVVIPYDRYMEIQEMLNALEDKDQIPEAGHKEENRD